MSEEESPPLQWEATKVVLPPHREILLLLEIVWAVELH
jgi:hypothetical protein